ncbi:hypothetical protein [Siphonobacter sp.]|uniref:hypothetical protein n=1 Tax=Siphonobacter sp. TaxID=1869184 RepID=UPI003B3ABF32
MQVKVLGSLSNFGFESPLDQIIFHDSLITTNVMEILEDLPSDVDVFDAIGSIFGQKLVENPVMFLIGDSSWATPSNDLLEINAKFFGYLQFIISSLWFIKDNGASVTECYSITFPDFVACNRSDVLYSNSSGEFRPTKFNKEDFDQALQILPKIAEIKKIENAVTLQQPEGMSVGMRVDEMSLLPYNQLERLSRSLHFLHLARSTSILPLKISFYIAILECLFTSDKTEVTHKVTEAATLFVGGDFETKKGNFELVKTAYGIRSSYVHGQHLEKKHSTREFLMNISNKMDSFLRELYRKAIDNQELFKLSDKDYRQYFRDMILGKQS